MKKALAFLLTLLVFSCSSLPKDQKSIELIFLDEYVYPNNKMLDSTIIGGLSGIDYRNGEYYLAVDDSRVPRYCRALIDISNKSIKDITFTEVVIFENDDFYKNNFLDLESILADSNNTIVLTSEGSIKNGKDPLLFSTTKEGVLNKQYELPKKFLATANPQPIHNKTLEGLSHSYHKKGYWTAFELPLPIDGTEPKYQEADSPVRFTYFDKKTGKATKEYVYQLSPITKPNKGEFNINGVTDILEFKNNHFFVIERTYQSDYGSYGNTVNIYHAYADKNITNSIQINSLKKSPFVPLKKELIFEFETIKDKLTEGIIDNIEGITFGPVLENGNQSLILVSDDNFQAYGKQLNQFILLEIKE